ncbi:MAG: right-handed parallel beta-helix repeat-containing protein [Desulfuromonadales bacterium]|nr:right-handed parallel beta-helix repeat-containing protein [Desulfuromonadales bacterium]
MFALRLMPKFLIALILFSLSGCAASAPPEPVRGTLHGSLVWQGEVYIDGDVVLEQDAELTIRPGTRILFVAPSADSDTWTEHPHFIGSELIVKGRIRAEGTAQAPIVFAAADATAPPGAWGAINLVGSAEAVFKYCIFRQADSALHSWDSQVVIKESLFERNLVGIRFNESNILIQYNMLRDNGSAIRFHFGAPVIRENVFTRNKVNLFITSHPRDYQIERNHFGVAREYHVVFGEEVPKDVAMRENFWLFSDQKERNAFFFDGQRSPYLGRVVRKPVLTASPTEAGLSWTP